MAADPDGVEKTDRRGTVCRAGSPDDVGLELAQELSKLGPFMVTGPDRIEDEQWSLSVISTQRARNYHFEATIVLRPDVPGQTRVRYHSGLRPWGKWIVNSIAAVVVVQVLIAFAALYVRPILAVPLMISAGLTAAAGFWIFPSARAARDAFRSQADLLERQLAGGS